MKFLKPKQILSRSWKPPLATRLQPATLTQTTTIWPMRSPSQHPTIQTTAPTANPRSTAAPRARCGSDPPSPTERAARRAASQPTTGRRANVARYCSASVARRVASAAERRRAAAAAAASKRLALETVRRRRPLPPRRDAAITAALRAPRRAVACRRGGERGGRRRPAGGAGRVAAAAAGRPDSAPRC